MLEGEDYSTNYLIYLHVHLVCTNLFFERIFFDYDIFVSLSVIRYFVRENIFTKCIICIVIMLILFLLFFLVYAIIEGISKEY